MSDEQKHKRAVLVIFAGIVIIMTILIVFTIDKGNKMKNVFKKSEEALKTSEEEMIETNDEAITSAMDRSTYKPVAKIREDDHHNGDLKADIHLIVYNDYASELGDEFNKTIDDVREQYSDRLVVAFRHFPLPNNKKSLPASLAVECAGEQGKFMEMHQAVLSDAADDEVIFGNEEMINNAEEINIDTETFSACLDNETYKYRIQDDVDEAREAGVSGAPTIFINGAVYTGALPAEDFVDSAGEERVGLKSLIEKHLAMADKSEENEEELTEEE